MDRSWIRSSWQSSLSAASRDYHPGDLILCAILPLDTGNLAPSTHHLLQPLLFSLGRWRALGHQDAGAHYQDPEVWVKGCSPDMRPRNSVLVPLDVEISPRNLNDSLDFAPLKVDQKLSNQKCSSLSYMVPSSPVYFEAPAVLFPECQWEN